MEQGKAIKLSFTTISIEAPNLVWVKLNVDAEIDLEKAETFITAALKLVENKPFYLLIDSRDIFMNIDHSAREYFATQKEYNDLNIAKALLVNNMPTTMILNFYKKFYSHKNPIEVFDDLDKAKEWLFKQG